MLKSLSCSEGSSEVQQPTFAAGPVSSVMSFSSWSWPDGVRDEKTAQDASQG